MNSTKLRRSGIPTMESETFLMLLVALLMITVMGLLLALLWLLHQSQNLRLLSQVLKDQQEIIGNQNNLILSKDPLVFQQLQASVSPVDLVTVPMDDASEAERWQALRTEQAREAEGSEEDEAALIAAEDAALRNFPYGG